MVSVRLYPGDSCDPLLPPNGGGGFGIGATGNGAGGGAGGGAGAGGGRLNLLLSYAGWEPEPWIDRLPRLLEPMGIASLRAGSGREASEVILRSRVHVAVVDLGLPLESGTKPAPSIPSVFDVASDGGPRLLELLARLAEPPPVVVIKRARTTRDEAREMAAALRLGAFAIVDRPRGDSDLDAMLDVLRRVLARYYKGRWPGAV